MTKTADHYKVIAKTPVGWFTLDISDSLQDAMDYCELHQPADAQVWVVFTDGSEQQVPA